MMYRNNHYAVKCRSCGSDLEHYYRVRKTFWQSLLFPSGMRFKCPNCPKKTFVTNIERFRVLPPKGGSILK